MIITLVISFCLHLGITFLLCFAYEKAKIWGDTIPELHQPTLNELQQEEDMLVINNTDSDEEKARKEFLNSLNKQRNKEIQQKYVEEIISPAYHYFRVKNEIVNYQDDRSEGCISFFILQFPTVALMTLALFNLELSESMILCIVSAIIPCLICDWLISFIYKKTPLCIKDFKNDLNLAKSHYEYSYNYWKEQEKLQFNISKEDYVNIEIIKTHNEYIKSIKDTVTTRYILRKIISIVGTVIYFVCIWGVGEY